MAQKILMPALSPTMTEGTLAKWLIAEGDSVQPGDIIAEIETDKAAMEVESIDEGVLSKILVPAGSDNIAVNTLIAVLKEKGDTDDDVAALLQGGVPLAAQSETPSQPTKELVPEAEPVQNAVPAAPIATHSTDERLFASPLAKRMAKDAGISLAAIKGSGPHGRIIKADVEHAKANPELLVSAPGDAASPASMGFVSSLRDPAHGYVPPFELTAHNNMRKTIAKRLQESKQSIPHFYLRVACQIDALLALRQEINARLVDEKISVNDMVLRAVALALNAEPDANASWGDDGMRKFASVDIAVAVAIEGGLITPIIRDADHKSLREIAAEIKELSGRARAGKLMPEEYQGGTVSVSNLGMFGIDSFDAIINPPQSCIFAIGAGKQKPTILDGAIKVGTFVDVTLSVDHRVIDGVLGAQVLNVFKRALENPLDLLI